MVLLSPESGFEFVDGGQWPESRFLDAHRGTCP
jgi:hypothetical protein